ncbi:MAG: hypothetical protein ACTSWL_07385 [Promethearchaeota archaeon]
MKKYSKIQKTAQEDLKVIFTQKASSKVIKNQRDFIQHLWIIEKQTSKMIFYHSFNNNIEFDGMLLSGLLSAFNSFSECELENQGIESVDMGDLRWVYTFSHENNIMVVGTSTKESNPKLMQARLDVIKNMFIKRYDLTSDFWKDWDGNYSGFNDFTETVKLLQDQWIQVNKNMNISILFDILGIFQQLMIFLIKIVQTEFSASSLKMIFPKLFGFSSKLEKWLYEHKSYHYFRTIELFLPKIDLVKQEIHFDESTGTNIFGINPIGLDQKTLVPIFIMVIEHFTKVIRENLGVDWFSVFAQDIKPYIFSHWDYLIKFDIMEELLKIFL